MFLSTYVYAIEKDPCSPKDVCCEEIKPGPFAFSYPKDVGLVCPRDFYVHAEFLLVKPTEDGLEYGVNHDPGSENDAIVFPLIDGKIRGFSRYSDEWDWRPGFRVGFGFYTVNDFWNFTADWTYIRIKSKSSSDKNVGRILLPFYYPPLAAFVFPLDITHISSLWSGDFNAIDFMVGKPYHVSRYFISNPMIGIKAAFIDQDYLIRYFPNKIKQIVTLKNDYWGVGLRGSYEGQFLIGSNFAIFGKTAFSMLFGKFDISQQNHDSTAYPQVTYRVSYKTEDSFYSMQPNAEMSLGFSWSKLYNKNQYLVSLKLAYEFQYFWDQYQARRFFDPDPVANDTLSRGDLSFNGFAFGLNVDF